MKENKKTHVKTNQSLISDPGTEKAKKSCWCCSHPAFIYSLLSVQFVQRRLGAEDIIDVSIREMAADWWWRSIPLHLACVVSTWLSLRQMLWEIIWR